MSVSLVVNGSTALIPLCDRSSSTSSSSSESSTASTRGCPQYSTSAGAESTDARGRRLRAASDGNRYPSSPLSTATTHRLLQEESDQSTNATSELADGGSESWAWHEDGPIFGLGELSRIRLSSHALLLEDGGGEAWVPLRNTSSAVATAAGNHEEEDEARAGVITASLQSFGEQEAVFSAMLFFSRAEAVEGASGGGGGVLGDSE